MTLNFLSVRGPSDDWDPQGYASDEDKVAEDLAELGMHTLEDKKEEAEAPDEIIPVVGDLGEEAGTVEVEEEELDEETAISELEELERAAEAMEHDKLVMPFSDEE